MAGRKNMLILLGWVSIYRSLINSPLWLSETFTRGQAWADLILLANHTAGFIRVRGNKIPLIRGQVGWSISKLANRWDWSRSKVKRFLNELEVDGMIEQQTNVVSSIISIVNYDLYQNSEQQTNNKRTAEKQQTSTNNNEKKKNNESNDKERFSPPSLEELNSFFLETSGSTADAEKFFNYYSSNGWKVGNNPMKDWQSAARNWAMREAKFEKQKKPITGSSTSNFINHGSDF